MKHLMFFVAGIFLLFSCNTSTTTFSDPQEYNDAIMNIVYSVQYPMDTLELELLQVKKLLENNPDSIINYDQIDTNYLFFLHNRAKKQVKNALLDIKKISFDKGDDDFKPMAIEVFKKLDTSLQTNFDTLIYIICNSHQKKSKEVLYKILPYGKKSYKDFEAAFDSLFVGQRKFDVKNQYFLQNNCIIFHL